MKKYLFIIPLVAAITLSCNKSSNLTEEQEQLAKTKATIENLPVNTCGTTTIDQLPWAQTLVSGKGDCTGVYTGAKLTLYTYRGGQVFYFENLASSLGICTQGVYNCAGVKIIDVLSDKAVWADFTANRTNAKVLWSK